MLLEQLVNGLALGAVYTLIALSFSLVMGVLGVLNIAVAVIFVLGGYLGFEALSDGWSIWGALGLALAGTGVVGVVVERLAYRPLRDVSVIMPLLSTLGCAIVIQAVIVNVWGSDPLQLEHQPFHGEAHLGSVTISTTQFLIVGTAIVLVTALAAMMRWTWTGRSIRAVAEDSTVASMLGVPASRVTIAVFALSGVLAGAAGLLIGLNYGSLTPFSGFDIGLKGIAVMVIGGTRNVWGGLIVGPLMGIAEVLTIAYGSSEWRDMVVWGFLIVALLLRPEGLFTLRAAIERRV